MCLLCALIVDYDLNAKVFLFVFSVTGLDDWRNVFEQEVQATASHVHTQSVLGAGEHTKGGKK